VFEKYAIFDSFLDLSGGLKSFKKHGFSMFFAKNAFSQIAFEGSVKKSIFRSPGGAWEPEGEFQQVLLEISGFLALCRGQRGRPPTAQAREQFSKENLLFHWQGRCFVIP
jgi:hypothetical protein